MTDRSVVPSPRTARTIARSATASSAALVLALTAWTVPAGASGNPAGASSTASLQVQAQELAGQIEADGRTLDELDAAYNGAQIRLQSLDQQLSLLQSSMASTTAKVNQARSVLKQQAMLAYITGGAPLVYVPDRPGQDPSLSASYAEIIAGGQKRAADEYHVDLQSMGRQAASLQATREEASFTLSSIRSDQSQAATALAAQQQALSQVKGQMAVLVSQVEQTQQQAQAQAQNQNQNQSQAAGSPSAGAQSPAGPPGPNPPKTGGSPAPSAEAPSPTTARPTPTTARPTQTTARPTQTTAPAGRVTTTTTTASTGPGSGGGGGSSGVVPSQAPGAGAALGYARAQLGKPYQWAGAGPNSFDCSGLVMMAWARGGVQFPHLAQDQYDMTARIPVSQALPGDLIFFGTPDNVYHVGIYIGSGQMIDAPETGQNVSVQSIYWDSLLGAGRVHN